MFSLTTTIKPPSSGAFFLLEIYHSNTRKNNYCNYKIQIFSM
uniref:Uncharacterized protein n=1 Tax=Proteus mirabilis TaxID=584 RepID=A0A7L4ZBZ6_PROMI|nr:hypothetical protein [Proteus mirabilis]WBR55639.1 hypothetical protein [Proteus mirabilis]